MPYPSGTVGCTPRVRLGERLQQDDTPVGDVVLNQPYLLHPCYLLWDEEIARGVHKVGVENFAVMNQHEREAYKVGGERQFVAILHDGDGGGRGAVGTIVVVAIWGHFLC